MAEDLTAEEAKKCNELVEYLNDNGLNQGLVVVAPHGGKIEEYTDLQAEHIGKPLSSEQASEWICNGFNEPQDAFDRWHVTSTEITEESFPKLKTLFGRANLNIPLPSMVEIVIPFASEEEESQTI